MNKQDFIKGQTCILKVDIHCEGCKEKVKKKLQKIDGVYAVKIEAEEGKVTVTGNIDSATLIKNLLKAGKHAQLWGPPPHKGGSTNNNNQFKNMQIDGSSKSQRTGKQQNNGLSQPQPQPQQNLKGSKDSKLIPKEQKSVKFKASDEDFLDDDDDDDDSDDDGFDDDDDFDAPHPLKPTKKSGGGGNNGSKGDNGMMKVALGGGNGKKNGGGMVGGEGKNGNANGKASTNSGKNGGGGGKINVEGQQHTQMGGKNVNQMANYPRGGQMAAMAMAPPLATGQGGLPPTMNPGLYQGMGGQGNPYMNQQQYMMMMNQQQAYGNGMYPHPMMYAHARPMGMAMPPHPPSEDYGVMFSDENPNSCSII